MIIPVAFLRELESGQQGAAEEKRSREEGAPLVQGTQAEASSGGMYLNPFMQPLTGCSRRVVASRKDNMVLMSGLLVCK